jgi:tRNA pseudouridine38-40 synthase
LSVADETTSEPANERPARRIRITVAYDGTDYHGWQVQPGLPTIQGSLEAVLSEMEGSLVHVAGSGRTDAGVHALAQVAAFSLNNPIPVTNLQRALNRVLPRDIRVLDARETAADFHPRYAAVAKTYEYRILRSEICMPFDRRYVYHHPYPLREESILELAPMLEGEHDFSAFAAADKSDDERRAAGFSAEHGDVKVSADPKFLTKTRCIYSSRAERTGDRLVYRVRGSGFLKHMVRNIVGVLLEVGKGNLSRTDLEARLKPECKIPPGPTAPARGLFLLGVEYDDAHSG